MRSNTALCILTWTLNAPVGSSLSLLLRNKLKVDTCQSHNSVLCHYYSKVLREDESLSPVFLCCVKLLQKLGPF